VWILSGQGFRLLEQAGYFLIVARVLGVKQYGAFVGVLALASILTPFSAWGTGAILIKHVSRDKKTFATCWGNALFVNLVLGALSALIVLLISRVALPRDFPYLLIVTVAVSELICRGITNTAGQAFQAFERMAHTAKLPVVMTSLKLAGAVAMWLLFPKPTALIWSCFYLIASIVTAIFAIVVVNRSLGRPRLDLGRLRPEMWEGLYFSLSLSSQTIYNDVDKTMLTRLSTLDATGIYSAAYRLIDMAFLPVRSLLNAAYPGFFRHGASGISGSVRYAKRLVGMAAGYGAFATAVLFLGAPVLPRLLGSDYARSVEAVRWLAPLVLIKSFHYFAADSLTGAGLQRMRTSVQFSVAVFNVLINLWIIPAYSWRGAAWSSLASDALLAVGLWMVVAILYRRHSHSNIKPTAELTFAAE
jgi:O-antigen/teichoic acid export membrane protein